MHNPIRRRALIVALAGWLVASAGPAAAKRVTDADLAALADAVYHVIKKGKRASHTPAGFILRKTYRTRSGVDAAVFEHKRTGAIVLALTGTQMTDPRDALADVGIISSATNAGIAHLLRQLIDGNRRIPKVAKPTVKKAIALMWGLNLAGPCPRGQWPHRTNCWACPRGSHRTAFSKTGKRACMRRLRVRHARAKKKRVIKFGRRCRRGEFWDKVGGLLGACWACPRGYRRSIAPVTTKAACIRATGVKHLRARRTGPAQRGGDVLKRGMVRNAALDRQVAAALGLLRRVTALKKRRNRRRIKLGEITVTGHSLGGFLAQVVAFRRRVKQAVGFNAPGAAGYLGTRRRLRNVRIHAREHDVGGRLGRHIGRVYIYPDVPLHWNQLEKNWLKRNHSSDGMRNDLARRMKPKRVL